ncbi:MAG: DUF1579 domain-containing protein [Acidobacteriota bacterium]
MKIRRSFIPFSGVLSLLFILPSSPAFADDKPKAAKPAAAGAAAMSQDEMMKAWTAFAMPGAPHKTLETFVGSWDVKTKMWMAPGAPPQETTGTSENKMILGGRYLEQRYEGTMMGQPFSGIGVTGYDNYKKKFTSTWVDSMGTGIMEMTGTADKTGKVITSWGMMDDPAEKRSMKAKTVVTIVDADHHTYESWHTLPDGKMTKDLEISYTRKK